MSDKARKGIAVGLFVVALAACVWPFVGGGSLVVGEHRIHGVCVRETAVATAQTERTVVALRNGAAADYLTSKQHKLDILDVDAIEPDGGKSKLVARAVADAGELPPPVLVLYDAESGELLRKAAVDLSSADAVIEQFKKAGG